MTEEMIDKLINDEGWVIQPKWEDYSASLDPPAGDERSTWYTQWRETTYHGEPLIYPHWALRRKKL